MAALMNVGRTFGFIGLLLIGVPLACGGGDGSSPGARAGAGGEGGSGQGGEGGDDGSGKSGEGGKSTGEPSFLPLYASGSRLRAISVGEAGSKVRRLIAFFDQELELECSFTVAEDGEYRCLPLVKSLAAGFADEECEEPVLYDSLSEPCRTRQPYWIERPDGTACRGARVIALERRSLDAVYTESCGSRIELPEGALVFEQGEVVPPSRFVRAERVRNLSSAGFGVDELRGADGSRQVLRIVDAELGACSAREVEGGGLRCVSSRAFLDAEWYFADSDCESTPLAYAARTDGCPYDDPVRMALVVEPGTGKPARVVEVEPPVTGKVYERSVDSCIERDAEDVMWTLHPVGDALDVERLLSLERTAAGSGRARLPHYAHGGTLLTLESSGGDAQRFHDFELDVRCDTLETADGELVCVPEGVASTSLGQALGYKDSDCTEPVLPVAKWPAEYFAPTTLDYCGRGSLRAVLDGGFYAVGDEGSGSLYTLEGGAGCRSAGSGSYLELTPVEPDFMTMVEVVE